MIFNRLSRLFDEAGDGDGSGDAGTKKPVDKQSDKVKIGDKEYDTNNARSAMSLYESLQDPEVGKEIIETLARKAGLLDREGDVKQKAGETKREAESRTAKALKNKLGKDYEKFADSVGPAFDEIINEFLEERLGSRDAQNTKTSWERAVDDFTTNNKYEVTPDIESAMKDLIEEAPPNFSRKGFDPQKYLARMYKNAIEELDIEPPTRKATKSRRRDDSDEIPDIVVREAPKNVTIDDALDAAMKGIRFSRR